MQCPNCSATLAADSRFCTNCGATITQAASTPGQAMTDKTIAMRSDSIFGDAARNQAANSAGSNYPQSAPPQQSYQQPYQQSAPAQQPYQQPYQPSYQQPYQPSPIQGLPPQPQPMMGYNVPTQGGVSTKSRAIPAILMILSAVTMLIAVFLPFIVTSGIGVSVFRVFTDGSIQLKEAGAGVQGIYALIPALGVLGLIFGVLAYLKRGGIWGVLNLLVGLVMAGLMALFYFVATDGTRSGAEPGIAMIVSLVAGVLMLISSIIYLVQKRPVR